MHTLGEQDGKQNHAVAMVATKGFPYDVTVDATAEGTDEEGADGETTNARRSHIRAPTEVKVESNKLLVRRRQQIMDATGGSSRLRGGTDAAKLINMPEEEFIQWVREAAAARHEREFGQEEARRVKKENTNHSTVMWLAGEVRGLCERMSTLLQYVDWNITVVGTDPKGQTKRERQERTERMHKAKDEAANERCPVSRIKSGVK